VTPGTAAARAHGARHGARAGRAVREERLAPGGRGLAGRPGQGRSWRRAYRGRRTRPAPSPARGTTPAPRTGRIGPRGLLRASHPVRFPEFPIDFIAKMPKVEAVRSSEPLVARLHVDLKRQASALCAMR